LYGPTEASIDVSYWECGKDSEKGSSAVPIGQPIANTQLYIVDQNNNLCPPYVTGELLIGGAGLAKGYWNRPALTKEKFIPNPFGSGRLYRTGDLAQYRMDGVIEYIGRTDFQIKLRGLRVELGEIEKAMESHPAVEKAVVNLWRRAETDERLVAYLTHPDQVKPPSKDEMTSFLGKTLPDYMVPAHYILLPEMPLNANGKLDRKALPAPKIDPVGRSVLPPENEIQHIIYDLWKELLSAKQFGIDDNFFDVGGSSLTIMELGLLLEKAFGRQIGVMDLFRYPTIKGMATLIGKTTTADNSVQEKRANAQRKRRRAMADRHRLKKSR
jgi:acyl carrier protein